MLVLICAKTALEASGLSWLQSTLAGFWKAHTGSRIGGSFVAGEGRPIFQCLIQSGRTVDANGAPQLDPFHLISGKSGILILKDLVVGSVVRRTVCYFNLRG